MPKKGSVTLLIVILVMGGMLIISFGVSTLLVRQIKMAIASGESIVAYQAADSGIERAYFALSQNATTTILFRDYVLDYTINLVGLTDSQLCSGAAPLWTTVGSASFCLDVYSTPQGYVSGVKSIGKYKTTNRAIQVGSGP